MKVCILLKFWNNFYSVGIVSKIEMLIILTIFFILNSKVIVNIIHSS